MIGKKECHTLSWRTHQFTRKPSAESLLTAVLRRRRPGSPEFSAIGFLWSRSHGTSYSDYGRCPAPTSRDASFHSSLPIFSIGESQSTRYSVYGDDPCRIS